MAVDGFTGKNAYIKFGDTELQTYYRTASPTEEVDLVDKSAGSDDSKTYLAALKDGTMSLEIVMPSGTAGTALWEAIAPATEGTLTWGGEGTAITESVNAIVKSRGRPLTYNDLTTVSVEFQFSGDVS